MRINHNLPLNAWKNLTVNDGQTKSREAVQRRRIGRAADDAAGLSISEKMRGQIMVQPGQP